MKKIKALFLALLCSLSLGAVALTSCTPDKNNGGSSQQTVSLSSDEYTVYNAVSNSLSYFKNPSSVKVLAVSIEPNVGGRYVRISAQNGFGGNTTNIWQIFASSLVGPINDLDYFVTDSSISVSKINQRLNQYKTSMGW